MSFLDNQFTGKRMKEDNASHMFIKEETVATDFPATNQDESFYVIITNKSQMFLIFQISPTITL